MSDGFFGENGSRGPVDVGAFMDSDITGPVARLIGMGCLVSFGTTRDGGAVSLSVTHDGERAKSYFTDSREAIDWLERGCDSVGVGLRPKTSDEPAKRQSPRRGRSTAP
jgi:hypothetical protein